MQINRKSSFFILLTYIGFVVYGSLIPFRFRPVSLENAWTQFCQIPYLQLGVGSRADWVANILLYLLLSYLWAGWLIDRESGLGKKCFRGLAILAGCALLAAIIEFVQIFFSPRTVSLNDLIAENLGALLGLVLWAVVGKRIRHLWGDVCNNGPRALNAALLLFMGGYLLFCLFPFDFLVSPSEFSAKLFGPQCGILLAKSSQEGAFRFFFGLFSEIVLAIPFGVFFAMRNRLARRVLPTTVVFGGALGLAIETLQLFVASGVSQGVSVVSRIVGFGLGLWFFQWARRGNLLFLKRFIRPFVVLGLFPSLVVMLYLNGWLARGWIGIDSALAKFEGYMLLPFYYHYFSTETQAVVSVVLNTTLYVPLGVGFWGWGFASGKKRRAAPAVWTGGLASLVLETGKLFIEGKHPDFTNIVIAVGAILGCYFVLNWFSGLTWDNFANSSPTKTPVREKS